MKLLALNAIGAIALKTGVKIYLRSTENNTDHELWYALSGELCHYRGDFAITKKICQKKKT